MQKKNGVTIEPVFNEKDALISLYEVSLRLAVHPRTIKRLMERDQTFPRPIRVFPGKTTFSRTEVNEYIHRKMDERKRT